MSTHAADGFPWNRVNAARSYLLALKPWLGPVAMAMKIVPVDKPAAASNGWLLAPETDEQGRVYLDRSFCASQPLHVLAGALEHEYAKVSRDVFNRLSWVDPDDWAEIAVPAFQMEIVDAMEREGASLDAAKIETRLARSPLFTVDDMDDWGVNTPPSIIEAGAFSPAALGLPGGLSAETYAAVLLAARETAEPEHEPPFQGYGTEPGPGEDDGEAGGEAPSSADAPAEGGQDAEGSGEGPADDVGGDGGEGQPEDADEDSDEDEGAAEAGDAGDEQEADEAGGEGGRPSSTGDDTQEAPGATEAPEDVDDAPRSARAIAESAGGPDRIEALRKQILATPEGNAWSNAMPHHSDSISQSAASNAPDDARPVSPAELSQALNESATLTIAAARASGVDIAPSAVAVAEQRMRSRGLSWDRQLARVVSSALTSEMIRGSSDLTYSRPNPNQPEVGIRLMGMTGYAPKVIIVQDVSGSMIGNNALARSMDAVGDLMTTLMGRLSTQSTWVTVATKIVRIGDAATMSDAVRKQWSWGRGGTDLGWIIESLMGAGKPVVHEGRTLRAPDLLVVSTDAGFPWPKKRPSSAHRLVVVVYDDSHVAKVPDWVNRSTELVVVR